MNHATIIILLVMITTLKKSKTITITSYIKHYFLILEDRDNKDFHFSFPRLEGFNLPSNILAAFFSFISADHDSNCSHFFNLFDCDIQLSFLIVAAFFAFFFSGAPPKLMTPLV